MNTLAIRSLPSLPRNTPFSLPRSKQTITTWSSNEEKGAKKIHPSEDNLLISLEVIRGCARDKGAGVRSPLPWIYLLKILTRTFLLRPVFREPDKYPLPPVKNPRLMYRSLFFKRGKREKWNYGRAKTNFSMNKDGRSYDNLSRNEGMFV